MAVPSENFNGILKFFAAYLGKKYSPLAFSRCVEKETSKVSFYSFFTGCSGLFSGIDSIGKFPLKLVDAKKNFGIFETWPYKLQ